MAEGHDAHAAALGDVDDVFLRRSAEDRDAEFCRGSFPRHAGATTTIQYRTKSIRFLPFVTQQASQSVEDIRSQRAFSGQKIIEHDWADADASRDFGQR